MITWEVIEAITTQPYMDSQDSCLSSSQLILSLSIPTYVLDLSMSCLGGLWCIRI